MKSTSSQLLGCAKAASRLPKNALTQSTWPYSSIQSVPNSGWAIYSFSAFICALLGSMAAASGFAAMASMACHTPEIYWG